MTGSFGWNVTSGEIFWSEETYQIFDYDPAVNPSIASVMDRVHPDDVALVRSNKRRPRRRMSTSNIVC
jgi:hypothetical protein